MPYVLNGETLAYGEPFNIGDTQFTGAELIHWPREDLLAQPGMAWVEPGPVPPPRPRVTKARFGDLFTDDEHAAMNLIRWQCAQMDAAERALPGNPLVLAETLFIKFGLPAEFIELDLPLVADGLGLLGMLGVFGDEAATRIPQILADEEPS